MEGFVCTRWNGARLTPAGCAAKYRVGRDGIPERQVLRCVRLVPACVGCDVGKAHASGKRPDAWPDGSPIVRVTIGAHIAAPVERIAPVVIPDRGSEPLARPRAPRRSSGPRVTPNIKGRTLPARCETYEWRGRQMGFAELCRTPEAVAAGVRWQVVARRLRSGKWTVADAISTPTGIGVARGKLYEWRGRMLGAADLARTPEALTMMLDVDCITTRLRRGWPVERAITEPRRADAARSPTTYPLRGSRLTIAELARTPEAIERGLQHETIDARVRVYRWDPELAITTPASRGNRIGPGHRRHA